MCIYVYLCVSMCIYVSVYVCLCRNHLPRCQIFVASNAVFVMMAIFEKENGFAYISRPHEQEIQATT